MNLTKPLDELVRRAGSPAVTQRGAEAMAEVVRRTAAAAIGGDLRLSHFRGAPALITPKGESGAAVVTMQGATYALADKGRKRGGGRIYPRSASALSTPYGPRRSVKRSKSRGLRITDRAEAPAYEAGKRAIVAAVRAGRG